MISHLIACRWNQSFLVHGNIPTPLLRRMTLLFLWRVSWTPLFFGILGRRVLTCRKRDIFGIVLMLVRRFHVRLLVVTLSGIMALFITFKGRPRLLRVVVRLLIRRLGLLHVLGTRRLPLSFVPRVMIYRFVRWVVCLRWQRLRWRMFLALLL